MEITFIPDIEFYRLLKSGKDVKNFGVRKGFYVSKQLDEDRVIEFTISTPIVDRANDTVNVEGWKLDNYLKNPVVLWAHCYDELPVGKSLAIWVEDNKLKSKCEFTPQDVNPFGYMVYQLYRDGFLNATSVGFYPTEFEMNEERDGVDYLSQELLEYSCVPVPANPEALVSAKTKGINLLPLKEWAEKVLDTYDDGVWVPKKTLEKVYKVLNNKTRIPVTKGVCGNRDLPLWDDEEWDADLAEGRMRARAGGPELENIDWDRYAEGFVYVVDGEEENVTGYKLPFADVQDGVLKAKWGGVRYAMSTVLGAMGGVDMPEDDRRSCYNFLATYYGRFDREVPEYKEYKQDPEWDETENTWRYRVRDPELFIEDSFRTKEVDNGVSLVLGKLKSEGEDGAMTVQSIVFSKDVFPNQSDAQAWLDDHPDLTKSYFFAEKFGRVLSEKNRTLIKSCVKEMREAIGALEELLEATEPQEDEIDLTSIDYAEKQEPDEVDIDANDLREIIKSVVGGEIRKLTGKLD